MKQLTAYEHRWIEVGEGGELTQYEAEALSAAENILPGGCLQWGHQRVKFTQFCGVVQFDDFQVEVLPKLSRHQSEAQQRATLLTMLTCAGNLQGLDSLDAGLATSTTSLLDVFIWHFAHVLERQLQQGLLRDYRDIDDNLNQVRGRIDLVRQHRENLFEPQRVACCYSELIADIPVNRLLHSALRLAISLATSSALTQHLRALRMRFREVGTLAHPELGPTAEQLNRMQRRYAPVVALAHLFLDGQFLNPRSGPNHAFSLLFDMNRLFERYTASRLRPFARQKRLNLMEQGPRDYLGEDETGRGRLLMRPDISFLDENKRPLIMFDAKWKLIDNADPLAALSAADLYQMSAYASAYGCSTIMLLYPEQADLRAGQLYVLTIASSGARLALSAVPVDGTVPAWELITPELLA